MSVKLKQMRDQRGVLVKEARALVDKAETEKRSMTSEEDGKYKELFGKQEELRASIEREEQLVESERQLAEQELRHQEQRKKGGKTGKVDDDDETRKAGPRASEEYRAAFERLLRGGPKSLGEAELRALQADNDTAGGFMVASEQFVDAIIQAVDDMVFVRRLATVMPLTTSASLGVPTLDTDVSDADWTAEIGTGNEDGAMKFGKRSLHPRPVAKRIKISKKLIAMTPKIAALVQARLAYKFGVTQEKAFLVGSGVNQPLGIFTASADGIPTSRDISADNGANAPTFDGLINAKYGLKAAYWGKSQWIFHRDVMTVVSKLKDGNGQYLWRQSVREGDPDTVLGRPVNMSEYSPNTLTTGKYVGALGDFSNYWIADAMDMQVQVLTELYAETNQTGFIGRMESDGQPVLAEAFVRVKLG